MAVSCVPSDLTAAAACYCFDPVTAEKIKIYLLAVAAGLEAQTPDQLAEAAKAYSYDEKTMKKVQTYLLCQLANASGA